MVNLFKYALYFLKACFEGDLHLLVLTAISVRVFKNILSEIFKSTKCNYVKIFIFVLKFNLLIEQIKGMIMRIQYKIEIENMFMMTRFFLWIKSSQL